MAPWRSGESGRQRSSAYPRCRGVRDGARHAVALRRSPARRPARPGSGGGRRVPGIGAHPSACRVGAERGLRAGAGRPAAATDASHASSGGHPRGAGLLRLGDPVRTVGAPGHHDGGLRCHGGHVRSRGRQSPDVGPRRRRPHHDRSAHRRAVGVPALSGGNGGDPDVERPDRRRAPRTASAGHGGGRDRRRTGRRIAAAHPDLRRDAGVRTCRQRAGGPDDRPGGGVGPSRGARRWGGRGPSGRVVAPTDGVDGRLDRNRGRAVRHPGARRGAHAASARGGGGSRRDVARSANRGEGTGGGRWARSRRGARASGRDATGRCASGVHLRRRIPAPCGGTGGRARA